MRYIYLTLLVLTYSQPIIAQDKMLIKFDMKDQFGNAYSDTSFADKYIILLGADREGSAYTDEWATGLVDSLKERDIYENAQIVALATLEAVPRLLRKMVRGFFPKDEEQWCLLDWDGEFNKTYGFKPAFCNVLIFDKEKTLIYQSAVNNFDADVAQIIINTIVDD